MNYTKILYLLMMIVTLSGCEKDDDDDFDDLDDVVGTAVSVSGEMDGSAAAKVVAYSSTGRYKVADITSGQFTLQLDNGKPWGLVFANSSGQYLGYLSLGDGIDAIPMHYLSQGVSNVDLGTITQFGQVFTPSVNPIGNSILLTPEQIEMIASADNYMGAILNNPDVDGNGVVDVIEGRFFSLSVIYFISPGRFQGTGLTPVAWDNLNPLVYGYRLFLTVKDVSFPESVSFSGPTGSYLSNTNSENYMSFSDHRVYATPFISYPELEVDMIPPGGTYAISYSGTNLTFQLSDQSYVASNIVYPWPTMTLNGDGTMNSLSWNYQVPSTTVTSDVNAIMRNLMIQIEGTGNQCVDGQNSNRLYDSPRLSPSVTSHTLSCQNIVWGLTQLEPFLHNVDRVMMTYEDHYSASYVVMYNKYW